MEQNKVTYAIIRAAVEKGIRDIQDNPGRGIRNLVDLGENFANGAFQKLYLQIAQNELQDEQSIYYALAERAVRETDPNLLTSFSMNLGYISWTYGASFIRELEEKQGFNVPWCLFLNLSQGGDLTETKLSNIITQGRELGIFSYILRLDADYDKTEDVLDILAAFPQCAFLLLADPTAVTEGLMQRLLKIRTIVIALDLDHDDPCALREAIALLKAHRCFVAGFSRYDDLNERLTDSTLLEQIADPDILILFLLPNLPHPIDAIAKAEERMGQIRQSLSIPILPIDLYSDVGMVDRNISSEACLVHIFSDGSVVVLNADEGSTLEGYSILENSLRDILAKSMPKKQ